ncbi:hypothetical protein Pmi06nite_20920 [Planotetraspora mira]|uniref:Uncharacterized protein n=1 Tax=Planotetraspora mira TaxID=58121 RepID=A0A8J3TWW6_9ACTN|nr:hypothetical protein Pmi06nite_20920 [Planotetraspora mira]
MTPDRGTLSIVIGHPTDGGTAATLSMPGARRLTFPAVVSSDYWATGSQGSNTAETAKGDLAMPTRTPALAHAQMVVIPRAAHRRRAAINGAPAGFLNGSS